MAARASFADGQLPFCSHIVRFAYKNNTPLRHASFGRHLGGIAHSEKMPMIRATCGTNCSRLLRHQLTSEHRLQTQAAKTFLTVDNKTLLIPFSISHSSCQLTSCLWGDFLSKSLKDVSRLLSITTKNKTCCLFLLQTFLSSPVPHLSTNCACVCSMCVYCANQCATTYYPSCTTCTSPTLEYVRCCPLDGLSLILCVCLCVCCLFL